MRKELNILASSILFFSRLPLPFKVPYSQSAMAKILTWFPFVGLIVGSLGAAVWYFAAQFLPSTVAIILSMISTLLLTGAFHEDGLADVCDGFGGGYNKERILAIMKDSTIGAYGALGMMMMLLSKYVALSHINPSYMVLVILVAHTMSRASALFTTQFFSYVRSENSKAKAPSQRLSPLRFAWALFLGFAPMVLLPMHYWYLVPLPIVVAISLALYYKKHIGGYTGDCLGCTQQLVELCIYISFIAFQ